ncbi:MAG TPA: PIG-L family deacetylase [Chloroflexota bacterium]|nr:PIG-L family deacetylase [Chloroflexota bacterium]
MTGLLRSPLCLLTIHAHPDDEASKGSATVAKYANEGVRTVLVSCTGGEAGDVLNKAMDTPKVRQNLAAVRAAELDASVAAIGYSIVYRLGYHDSGMPNTEWNSRPDNFHNAPLEEAVGRLVKIIRTERPQVIVTYPDDRPFRGHPDHIRVLEISGPAFDAAGDPGCYPEAGDSWQALKLYYVIRQSVGRMAALKPFYLAAGVKDPFKRWHEHRQPGLPEVEEGTVTTRIDVGDYLDRRRAALIAHRSQIDPLQNQGLRLSDEILRQAYPWDEYELARSLIDGTSPGATESDLFTGVRESSTLNQT